MRYVLPPAKAADPPGADGVHAIARKPSPLARLPFYYGWVIVAATFVCMALGVNARTAFSLFFPPILQEFGWESSTTAGTFSVGFLGAAALSPWLGWLMDRHGPRAVTLLGTAAMVGGLLLATLVSEPWQLYATLGLLVGGGSICLGYSGFSLFLPNWFQRRRGFATSIAFSGVGLGSILLLPWLQGVIESQGWRAACWALGVLVALLVTPLTLLLRKRPEDLGLQPDGAAASGESEAPGHAAIADPVWAATEWTLPLAMRTRRFWWVALGYFWALYVWYAVQVHQTYYLIEVGFDPTQAAWALGLVSLIAIPGQIGLGHLSDRIGREWVWSMACLGFVLSYLLLLAMRHWPGEALLYAMIGCQGALGYGMTSVMAAIAAEIFQGRNYGRILGALMLAMIAGGAVGPWLSGLLRDASGSYDLAFVVAIVGCGISAGAIWLAGPRHIRPVGRFVL
ncbi:MAG: MFS transporter [Alphaproteobacteria bacterium]|nr:MFS transporter [Alphaproteobacteria bacterium]